MTETPPSVSFQSSGGCHICGRHCMQGLFCALKQHWRTNGHLCQEGWDSASALVHLNLTLQDRNVWGVSICGWHAECNLSQSSSLACVPPCPQTPMNDISGFCYSRPFLWIQWNQVCCRKQCQRAEKEKGEQSHTTESSLLPHTPASLVFLFPSDMFSHSYLRAFALAVLSDVWVSRLKLPFLRRAFPTAHRASPSCPVCPVPLFASHCFTLFHKSFC